jgi:MFS family permease
VHSTYEAKSPGMLGVLDGDRIRPYAYYALFLLILANFFNYFDRQIISVLAEEMKKDLQLTDAQLGFLFGTAFALLFGLVAIPLGRIADRVSRTKLMALGLTWWSAMTGLAGTSTTYGHFAAARIGVGLGEATCNPCSHSLLSEYFPVRNRSAALGSVFIGAYVGTGSALFVGGVIVSHWASVCHVIPFADACSVRSWQAAFLIAGFPGLILAIFIALLKEPVSPAARRTGMSAKAVFHEVAAALPPFTLLEVSRLGGGRAALINLMLAAAAAAAMAPLILLTGDGLQWTVVGVGIYAVASWAQGIRIRDPGIFRLTFGDRTFMLSLAGTCLIACFTQTVYVWSTPYAIREIGMTPAAAGAQIGLALALSGCLGVVLGGWLTDIWKRRDPRAPLWVSLVALWGPAPCLIWMMHTNSSFEYVMAFALLSFIGHAYVGGIGAMVQDLILPRMRGTASAIFSMMNIVAAASLGPYVTGKVSTLTGSLSTGLLTVLVFVPCATVLLMMAAPGMRHVTTAARAALAGEEV